MTAMLPTIDPDVRFVGTSFLRTLNATSLRELKGAVVIQDNDEPLAVIIPYETYLDWQDADREPSRLIGQWGGALAGQLGKKLSKKTQLAEARKAADPLAQNLGREDIDYMNPDELPSAGSVGIVAPHERVQAERK